MCFTQRCSREWNAPCSAESWRRGWCRCLHTCSGTVPPQGVHQVCICEIQHLQRRHAACALWALPLARCFRVKIPWQASLPQSALLDLACELRLVIEAGAAQVPPALAEVVAVLLQHRTCTMTRGIRRQGTRAFACSAGAVHFLCQSRAWVLCSVMAQTRYVGEQQLWRTNGLVQALGQQQQLRQRGVDLRPADAGRHALERRPLPDEPAQLTRDRWVCVPQSERSRAHQAQCTMSKTEALHDTRAKEWG